MGLHAALRSGTAVIGEMSSRLMERVRYDWAVVADVLAQDVELPIGALREENSQGCAADIGRQRAENIENAGRTHRLLGVQAFESRQECRPNNQAGVYS